MTISFRPFSHNVLVLRSQAEDKTHSGLFIPEDAAEAQRPFQGEVIAVGADLDGKVNVGEIVAYGKYSGTPLLLGDAAKPVEHVVLTWTDLLGAVEGIEPDAS